MPFDNVRELEQSDIGGIEKLTEREKRIFLQVFNDAAYSGQGEGDAIAQAFSAAKKGGRGETNRTLTT